MPNSKRLIKLITIFFIRYRHRKRVANQIFKNLCTHQCTWWTSDCQCRVLNEHWGCLWKELPGGGAEMWAPSSSRTKHIPYRKQYDVIWFYEIAKLTRIHFASCLLVCNVSKSAPPKILGVERDDSVREKDRETIKLLTMFGVYFC